MSANTVEQIRELGRRWLEAEERNDADALERLLASDFKAVGPFGYVLDKQQWLDRYRSGAYVTKSLTFEDVDVRVHGDTAVAIGRETQQATYQGQPSNGRFRVTQIAIREGDRWVFAGMHLSPLAEGA